MEHRRGYVKMGANDNVIQADESAFGKKKKKALKTMKIITKNKKKSK